MLEFQSKESGDASPAVPESTPANFHERIRRETRICHDEVDRLYGQFDLTERGAYGDFLAAHARALFPVETWLSLPGMMGGRPRSPALRADLAALGRPLVVPAPIDWKSGEAERWGAAYVVEGSRLGGALLKRGVPAEFPCEYLSSIHPQGGWRAFTGRLDELAAAGGLIWEAQAIASAKRTFALFADAAIAWGAWRGR